jgi:hypothetical protein
MDALKLVALDEEDLKIVSAHVQDAVMKVADLSYAAREKRFVIVMNRFAWEERGGFIKRNDQRRRSVLSFDRVAGVRTSGIDRQQPDEVLSLLALRFEGDDLPAGTIELVFSADATMRLDVECIEARLADVGGTWQASSRPTHGT